MNIREVGAVSLPRRWHNSGDRAVRWLLAKSRYDGALVMAWRRVARRVYVVVRRWCWIWSSRDGVCAGGGDVVSGDVVVVWLWGVAAGRRCDMVKTGKH